MITREENEFLTRVGPGTPAGELLRRYWQPVAVARELTPEQPTKFVRILGEDLVLFLDKSGRAGLLADHCSHRSASLLYGRVEERGIACAYHGWLYDTQGNILETPPERNDAIMKSVKQTAYPVQRFLGVYWAYLGPQPAPRITPLDIWMRKDGRHGVVVYPIVNANWLQSMENSVDPAHLQILHLNTTGDRPAPSTTRGFIDDVDHVDFYETSYGIMKHRVFKDGHSDQHPLIFPNNLRQSNSTQFRVPIDDTHTWHFHILFEPSQDGSLIEQSDEDVPVTYMEPFKYPQDASHPYASYTLHVPLAQDQMAWESPGPVSDRTREHLAASDQGVVMLRRILKREILKVQQGLDPLGVVRDADLVMIDTKLDAALSTGQYGGGRRIIWQLADKDSRVPRVDERKPETPEFMGQLLGV